MPKAGPRRHNAGVRYLILFIVLLGLGAGGWWLTRPKPVTVTQHTLTTGTVRSTVANTRVGTVEACRRAKMSPSAAGQVASLPVSKGQQVAAGTMLMEIWNEDLKAQLRHTEAEITAAGRRVDEACTQAAGAHREANRLQRMAGRKLVSEDALDVALTRAKAADASCAAARANVNVAHESSAVVTEQIEKTRLRAPFAGVVAELNAKLGEFITPSPTGIPTLPAVDLIDMSCLYVSAPIDEVDAPQIKTGMPACVSLDAFPDKRCNAEVRRIAPYVLDREKQARTVEVEVELKGERDLQGLLPGYSADIEVLLAQHEHVVRIPSEAVIKGNKVLVLDAATHRLQEKTFTPGLANWEFTEVKAGLEAGASVVLSVGRDGVKAGALAVAETPDAEP